MALFAYQCFSSANHKEIQAPHQRHRWMWGGCLSRLFMLTSYNIKKHLLLFHHIILFFLKHHQGVLEVGAHLYYAQEKLIEICKK